jgi:hypothetical protein
MIYTEQAIVGRGIGNRQLCPIQDLATRSGIDAVRRRRAPDPRLPLLRFSGTCHAPGSPQAPPSPASCVRQHTQCHTLALPRDVLCDKLKPIPRLCGPDRLGRFREFLRPCKQRPAASLPGKWPTPRHTASRRSEHPYPEVRGFNEVPEQRLFESAVQLHTVIHELKQGSGSRRSARGEIEQPQVPRRGVDSCSTLHRSAGVERGSQVGDVRLSGLPIFSLR